MTTRYLYADKVDVQIGRVDVDEVCWTLTDYQGSVRDVIDSNAALMDSLKYGAFGNITYELAQAYGGLIKYTGRFLDPDTGLQENRDRWYDSGTGRWQTQDPIGFGAGDSNLYRYVMNRATYALDPSGLEEHHLIPRSLWEATRPNHLGFSAEAQRVFQNATVNAPGHRGWSSEHAAYNSAARSTTHAWLTSNGVRPEHMTASQANQLVAHIQGSRNPTIAVFLTRITGNPANIQLPGGPPRPNAMPNAPPQPHAMPGGPPRENALPNGPPRPITLRPNLQTAPQGPGSGGAGLSTVTFGVNITGAALELGWRSWITWNEAPELLSRRRDVERAAQFGVPSDLAMRLRQQDPDFITNLDLFTVAVTEPLGEDGQLFYRRWANLGLVESDWSRLWGIWRSRNHARTHGDLDRNFTAIILELRSQQSALPSNAS